MFNGLASNATLATLFAHIVGMLLSMFFTIDFWLTRLYGKASVQTNLTARVKFLTIASLALATSLVFSLVAFPAGVASNISLLCLNWACLACISILKYFALLRVLTLPKLNRKEEFKKL